MGNYKTEKEFKKRCYELYQLNWLRSHGYSLQDIFNTLQKGYAEACASGDINKYTSCSDNISTVERYFEEQGICGELYASEEEFYDNEYKDTKYMASLLAEDMLDQYIECNENIIVLEGNSMSVETLHKIEDALCKHDVYVMSSVDGAGAHVGRFKEFSYDANGALVIMTDIDSVSCTG